jgi:hypothetical protein
MKGVILLALLPDLSSFPHPSYVNIVIDCRNQKVKYHLSQQVVTICLFLPASHHANLSFVNSTSSSGGYRREQRRLQMTCQ